MAVIPTSRQNLNVGDKVKMNISLIERGDLDGIAYTTSGKDYWRYMNEHPDEVYTVTAIDTTRGEGEICYCLDGYMSGNNWYSDELIHIPAPSSRYEVIKNMTLDEMATDLLPLLSEILEDGLPSNQLFKEFLEAAL